MIRWITILAFFLMPLLASAEDVAIPPLQHRVTDLTATLTASQQADLESRLAAVEAKKGSQIAILIVPSTQPEDIAQYSIRVVEAWKLGRKGVDDGVLMLLAKGDHRSRIEVGYGLEGALPDAIAKRITTEVMRPYFSKGDFYGGLVAGTDKIVAVLNGEALPEVKHHVTHGLDGGNALFVALMAAIVVGGLLRSVLGKFVGGLATGGIAAVLLYFLGAGLLIALVLGIIAFFMTLIGGQGLPIGYGGGGFGGGSGGGGGFSGGGGGFGGGGASGDW